MDSRQPDDGHLPVDRDPEPDGEPGPDVRWVRHRPTLGPVPRWGFVALLVLFTMLVGYRMFMDWVSDQVIPTALPGDEVEFTIEEGWSTSDVALALGDAGVVDNSAMFRQWMRCPSAMQWLIDCPAGVEYSFQAGDYVLREHLTFEMATSRLAEGPLPVDVIRVTVPEGMNLNQMVARVLKQLPAFDELELRAALTSDRLVWEHYPDDIRSLHVEGLLFPDTYQLDESTVSDELGLLIRMHRQFLKVVDDLAIETRSAALGITPYDAVILASLIEEEARIDAERAKVSRVIHNRLDRGWLLGIDATTRYAVGKTAGEPLDVQDFAVQSRWNTRVVAGLPPSPISAPGRASLEAALNPVDGPWLYYVRTDEGGVVGSHTFVVTPADFETARRICIDKDLGCG